MKPRLLMIAYACDPIGGGEHWLGWGWAEQAAQNFEVDLITTPKAEAAVRSAGEALRIAPHFVEVPSSLRKVTELCGGAWLRKIAWQNRVAKIAANLHKRKSFALVHQTTFHTFRSPFTASALPIPSIWGPIAGGEHVPPGFEKYLGAAARSERTRIVANRAWLKVPSIRRSLRNASALFISNRTTLNFLPADLAPKSQIVPPNALREEDERWRPRLVNEPGAGSFRLLYVGNCVATRALPLVFEALQCSGLKEYRLSIVGSGPALPHWQEHARRMGLTNKVSFVGRVPLEKVNTFYQQADALVFPALRDSGGSAVLEAMARYVPVICLDWAGPSEMLDEHSGLKVQISSPASTVADFAQALVRLSREPELRARLAAAARRRAEQRFSWRAKRLLLESTFERLTHKP